MSEHLSGIIEIVPQDPVWLRFALVILFEIGYIATMIFS